MLAGNSGPDFPQENLERGCSSRAGRGDLSDLGARQMGFLPWNLRGGEDNTSLAQFVEECNTCLNL